MTGGEWLGVLAVVLIPSFEVGNGVPRVIVSFSSTIGSLRTYGSVGKGTGRSHGYMDITTFQPFGSSGRLYKDCSIASQLQSQHFNIRSYLRSSPLARANLFFLVSHSQTTTLDY